MDILGFVSRIKNGRATTSTVNGRLMENQNKYSTTISIRYSSEPKRVAILCGNIVSNNVITRLMNTNAMTDWVKLIFATFFLPCDKLMEVSIPPPMPNINPTPVIIIKIGAEILTAAIASLPIPFPTKIPSTTVNSADAAIPIMVRTSNLVNSFPTLMLLKSRLSLCISIGF